jgi:CRP/FNR family transcriptional regulator, cyclic AMP receptor protein
MLSDNHLNDARLKKFLRLLAAGEFLFKEGQPGNTMFILVKGSVNLVETRGLQTVTYATLKVGETIGERAILSEIPYPRTFAVEAGEESVLMEFGGKTLKIIEAIIPDFTLRVLQNTVQRLDRMNRLVKTLRSTDPSERFINTLLFFAHFEGTPTPQGVELKMTPDDFFRLASLSPEFTDTALAFLFENKVLIAGKNGMVLTDENMLHQVVAMLREKMAA